MKLRLEYLATGFIGLLFSSLGFADLPPCPVGGAVLNLVVDNESGAPQAIQFDGNLAAPSCALNGLASNYSQKATCATGITTCLKIPELVTGVWSHQISVGAQLQNQQSLLVGADPNAIPNSVTWTAFKSVITVDNISDDAAICPSVAPAHSCTLRGAIAAANTAALPVLVQFDPQVFSADNPTTIQLTNSASLAIGDYVVIDGTDSKGNPAFVGAPEDTAANFNRRVQLPSLGSGFNFTGKQAMLKGLLLQRATQTTGATPGDVIFFNSNSANNTVMNVKVDGGGANITDKTAGQDCIGTSENAGTASNVNSIINTEIQYCLDKGVKSAYGSYLTVVDSWVHQSIGGGLQATLSGTLNALHNVVEKSGSNATTLVYTSANGLSSHGADSGTPTTPSALNTQSNLVRNNALRGLTANQIYANAAINADFSCGNLNGLSVLEGATKVTVRNSAFVFNNSNGVVVDATSAGDFGTDSSAGNNAFAVNGYDFENDNASTTINAIWDQWTQCPTKAACTPKIKGNISYYPWLPYAGDAEQFPLLIDSFYPKKARANDIVHISGSGFNAVDGFPAGGQCTANFNSCDAELNPVNGICVYYYIPNTGQAVQPKIVSITPSDIGMVMNTTCSQPTTVIVKRWDNTSVPAKIITASGTFCTNS